MSVKISALPAASTPTGAEVLPVVQAGTTVKMTVDQILSIAAQGVYESAFQSGYLQYTGPGQSLAANANFEVGLVLPNPTGTPGPCMLLGSGGGAGTPVTFCIIQDEAFDNVTPGNTLIITAGETQPAGTANGGLLWLIGGGSNGGTGGELLLQGGTSLNGAGGLAVLQGGNATNAGGAPGDVFVIGGEVGNTGAAVHLVSTTLGGVAAPVRIANGSDITHTSIMADFLPIGAPSAGSQPFGIYLYGAGGFGAAGQPMISGGAAGGVSWLSAGFTGSVTISGQTLTFASGLCTGAT